MALDFGLSMMATEDDVDEIIAKNIPLDKIDDDPNNQEIFSMSNIEELASFIDKVGFLGAIDVYLKDDGRYQIISGHRRVRAMRHLGRTEIPAIICEEGQSRERAHQLIGSNLLTRAVSPLEKAKSYYYLLTVESGSGKKGKGKFNESAFNEVSKTYGINKGMLSKIVRLVFLIPELQSMVKDDIVPWTSIYQVSDMDEEMQKKIANALTEKMKDLPEEDRRFTSAEINAVVNSLKPEEVKPKKKDKVKVSKIRGSFDRLSKETSFLVKVSEDKLRKSPDDLQAFEESVESLRETLEKLEKKLTAVKG